MYDVLSDLGCIGDKIIRGTGLQVKGLMVDTPTTSPVMTRQPSYYAETF